jgi:ATP-dependent Clp protease ATP-binding subunit ClpA
VKEVLERARDLARKRRHARVGEVHLLAALANDAAVLAHMSRKGCSLARLDEHLREALAKEQEAGTFRDVPEPEVEPEVTRLVAAEGGFLAALRRPKPRDVFDRLLERRNLAAALRFDETTLRRFYEAAMHEMWKREEHALYAEHALLALTGRRADGGRFREALVVLGHDPEMMRAELAGVLVRGHTSVRLPPFSDVVARATELSNATGRRELGLDFIVVDILRWVETKRALKRVGIDPHELLFAYVHGVLPAEPRGEGAAELVLFHDDFTPRAMKLDGLTRAFGLSAEAADALLLESEETGRGRLPLRDAEAARRALREVRATAFAADMPLRIELRRTMT